ncbi:MAG: transcription antitermination factor NusB [Candidatus Azobacteroides pseudotrichonymphae]|nr:transcription antitermination protein NusB [Bacteroidales bacterium OttesenSCG-928-I14]GMO34677.1 MAG: transcription antitermination factor NusB [Candidatus Azobacteroides pseudotrichonymphae]
MINRTFIRTKVLQILYAYHQKGNEDLMEAENELNLSLQKTRYLYYYLLLIIIELTNAEQKKLDKQKHKHSLLFKEQYINRKFADNFLAKKLRNHIALIQFANKHSNWLRTNSETDFIELLLNEIKQSDNYTKYISSNNAYKNNYEFWEAIFKQIILKSQIVSEWLEQKSIYWNDDLEATTMLVLKTLKQFQDRSIAEPVLLPLFKDNTTQEYAIQLLRSSIIEAEENSDLIDTQMKNWDKKRIALLDLIIMQMALAELNNFPAIPLKVTLNEYIDLARYYSTPKSTSFINGILQAIVSILKINKN